jgi:D-alanyl-D-alanine carboxypeptidase
MTSGISNFTRTATFKNLIATAPTSYHPLSFFVDLAYQQNDEFTPGKNWYYSNTNYYLLGILIEKITNHSLTYELQQRFIKPLHLNNTFYAITTYPDYVYRRQAHAYYNKKDVTNEVSLRYSCVQPNF